MSMDERESYAAAGANYAVLDRVKRLAQAEARHGDVPRHVGLLETMVLGDQHDIGRTTTDGLVRTANSGHAEQW